MGRRLPSLLVGESVDRVVTVGGSAFYDERCGFRDACEYDSPRDDWETAAWDAEVVCYRDHTGRRMFGSLGDVATDDVFPGVAGVGFSVTASDYTELPGIAPTFGENLADPAWLLSATGWTSYAFGYQFPTGGFTPEAGGMRVAWNPSPSQAGNGYQSGGRQLTEANGLEAGKRYRFQMRLVLAPGSTQVRVSIPYTTPGFWVSATGVPVDAWVDYVYPGGTKGIAVESGPNPTGSVLIQSMSIKERAA